MEQPEPSKAKINYHLLAWARHHRRLSLPQAAKDILPPATLLLAEEGELQITFDQFRDLAGRYRFAITFFYLDKLPTLTERWHWATARVKAKFVKWINQAWGNES